jgi:hypothetical protein
MASLKDLLSVQVGKQTVIGTAVTATAKLMGVTDCQFTPINDALRLQEIRGSLAPAYNAVLTKIGATGKLSMYGSYQDINYAIESLLGTITPSGAGPYVRATSAPIGTVPAPRIQTLIWGDGTNCYKATGMLITKITLKGASNAPLMLDCDWVAYSVTTGSLAGLSDRSINVAMAQDVLLYVDTFGGTIGSTAISAIAWDFQMVIDSKRALDWYLGALGPGNYHEGIAYDGSLDLNLELQAGSKAYLDEQIGGSVVHQRQIRVKYTQGAGLITQLDFAGSSEKAANIFDYRDGVVGVKIQYMATYNSTLANWFAYSNTNSVSTLP